MESREGTVCVAVPHPFPLVEITEISDELG
jgi:hypothetical protein